MIINIQLLDPYEDENYWYYSQNMIKWFDKTVYDTLGSN